MSPWGATPPQQLAADKSDDHQENDRADGGVDDRSDEAGEGDETQLLEQPDADEGADDTDDDVPEQPESKSAHDLPGEPAGNRADDEHNNKAVYSNHGVLPLPAG